MPPLPSANSPDAFLQITSRSELAQFLGITDKTLRFVLYRLTSAERYVSFEIKKRSGGQRKISAPIQLLKTIQRRLLTALSPHARVSSLALGFVEGKSILDHARRHAKRRHVLTIDLEDFFPSINFGRVRGLFRSKPFNFNARVATVLAQICCEDNQLPQGAPTSPLISNLICRALDGRLAAIAKANRCDVSRYADDICFSTNLRRFPAALASKAGGLAVAGRELSAAIVDSGFRINARKVKLRGQLERQMVTGLIVNDRVSMPRFWRRQLRVMLELVGRYGAEKAAKIVATWGFERNYSGASASIEGVIRGKAGHAYWLDKRTGRLTTAGAFSRALFRGYRRLRSLLPKHEPDFNVRLMTEGISDVAHLENALKELHARGEFLDVGFKIRNYEGDKGDTEVWETIRRIAKANVGELTIALFDCDNEKLLSQMVLGRGDFRPIGNNVYIATLAPPPWDDSKSYCIECLYRRNEIIRADEHERRIFFRDEFDAVTGVSLSNEFRAEFPQQKSIVLTGGVQRISDNKSVNLGKVTLAAMIQEGKAPFNQIDVSGFRPTFAVLRRILDERR